VEALRFDGRVAIVTGAGRGIGREHALLLAARGASVVVNDIGAATSGSGTSTEPADGVVAEIEAAGGTAVASYDSVASPGGAEAVVAGAVAAFGRLDVVINNAGNAIPELLPGLTEDHVRALADVHYLGTYRTCRAAWPHLISAGAARIVNTVSAAILGLPGWSGYGAAKGAVLGFTLNLATEAVEHGIRVNAIAPGAATRMLRDTAGDVPEGAVERMTATMPPRLVAPAAAFLAHESCPLNGEILSVAAGRVARVVLAETRGWASPDLTPEDVAEQLGVIRDLDGLTPWTIG